MLKKWLVVLIALLCLLAGSALGEEAWRWDVLENGALCLTGVEGEPARLDIPPQIDGKPVEAIGDRAFSGQTKLTAITFPEGLVSIGRYAFEQVPLKSVEIPESVTEIGEYAFAYNKSLTKAVIPGSLETVPNGLFSGCTMLKTLTIGEGVARIGRAAFCETGLAKVVIPDSVTTIGDRAFESCKALASVQLGKGLTVIGDDAFGWCKALKSITLPDGLLTIGKSAFSQTPMTRVVIPASVHTMGDGVFVSNKASMRDITFEGYEPFKYDPEFDLVNYDYHTTENFGQPAITIRCLPGSTPDRLIRNKAAKKIYPDLAGYETVVAPNEPTLRAGLYARRTDVVVLEIPEGVETIERGALSGLMSLRKLILPSTLKSIGPSAFENCYGLEQVEFRTTQLEALPERAFRGCLNLPSVSLPQGLVNIGKSAFDGCKSLAKVAWPEGLKTIGDNAFYFSGLTSLTLPEGVEELGSGAFENCMSLKSLVLPQSLKTLGEGVFSTCTELSKVDIKASLTELPLGTFYSCMSLKSLTLPEGLEIIGPASLKECTVLSSLKLPSTLRVIGEQALMCSYGKNNCALASIALPEGLERIDSGAFFGQLKLKTVKLPQSLIHLGDSAFAHTGLTGVTLPEGVTDVGTHLFANCKSLAKATWLSATPVTENAFYECSALAGVTLSEGVTGIDAGAFGECKKLKTLALPATITSIAPDAFENISPALSCPEGSGVQELIDQLTKETED